MLSEIKGMWVMVMFDLPTVTKDEKREYSRFRKYLLSEGFTQLQFSVYAKYCASRENSEKYARWVSAAVPANGYVRLLSITDKQFGDMISVFGKTTKEVEKKPEQLLLF